MPKKQFKANSDKAEEPVNVTLEKATERKANVDDIALNNILTASMAAKFSEEKAKIAQREAEERRKKNKTLALYTNLSYVCGIFLGGLGVFMLFRLFRPSVNNQSELLKEVIQ